MAQSCRARDGQLTNAVACAWFGSPPNTDIEKKAPGTSEAFKELTNPGIKAPRTLRYYPKAQIRQGADRVSAPARLVARRKAGRGLVMTAQYVGVHMTETTIAKTQL